MPDYSQQQDLIISVTDLIAKTLGVPVDQITEGLSYGDLPEWDSLGHMNIMMALEEKYGIQITTDVITSLINLKSITAYLLDHNNA
ncbi:MAG: acyl carrier protein [Anaerolineaceae bacterium]